MKLSFKLQEQDVWQRLPQRPLSPVIDLPPILVDQSTRLNTGKLGVVRESLVPRDYQRTAIEYLSTHKRRFLTDKPGLGKTLCAAYAAEPPVLIACPTYLVNHWYNFLDECGCEVVACTGNRASRQAGLSSGAPWIICNIEMMSERKLPAASAAAIANANNSDSDDDVSEEEAEDVYVKYDFPKITTLIVDESHHVRGHNSARSKQALALAKQAERVYLLTATPVYNKPNDFYAQLRMLVPGSFTSYWEFMKTYCYYTDSAYGPKIIGGRPNLKKLYESLSLGRTYQEVGMELPRLVGQTIAIEPDEKFKKEYKDVKTTYLLEAQTNADGSVDEAYEFPNALAVMQHLRRMTAPQKLKPMLEYMKDTDGFSSGTVIFTWYKNTAEQIAELLHIPCITGDMPPNERVKIAKSEMAIVATISSLSEGVDLKHLKNVVFLEEDYVPGRKFQALSRVRRFGGHEVVRVIYLMVKGTIDEVIHSINDNRTKTINQIVRESLA